jgi:hypothetical protein
VVPAEPISAQLLRVVPDLKTQRFSNLLSFEAESDSVFVANTGAVAPTPDSTRAHTGKQSLQIAPGVSALTVKASSLLSESGAFPGTWTLMGAYFMAEAPADVSVACMAGEALLARNAIKLPAGKWCAVLVDTSTIHRQAIGASPVSLRFEFITSGRLWCDDVMLVDNLQTIFEQPAAATIVSWSIKRRGLSYIGDMPDHYRFTLPAPYDAENGWTPVEVNALRARFTAFDGARQLTIYSDGRAFLEGAFRPIGDARGKPALAEAHASPAQIAIADGQGRVNRSTPGDANNDGYNEVLGAYTLVAAGSRLEFTITPRSAELINPILEITNVPAGELLVTSEGRLIERWVRLENGTVVIELTGQFERPTVVNVRAQGGDMRAGVR